MIDLSGLEIKTAMAGVATETLGKPLELLLIDIEEDPNQPRRTFDKESMGTMIESIRLNGVRTPVSVRTHPEKPGKWMLNYGARRYRASMAAGKTTIPAFVDQQHTDYHQVIENLQRDDLKPMELALFIQKKLSEGTSKAEIARTLSIPAATVTEHLSLIDPPECIETIYSKGKCTSPKTLYELRGLHKTFPKEVTRWCEKTEDITRGAVADLAGKLKGTTTSDKEKSKQKHTAKTERPIVSESIHDRGEILEIQAGPQEVGVGQGSTARITVDAGATPIVYLEVKDRGKAVLILDRQSQNPWAVMVQFEKQEPEEVLGRDCTIDHVRFEIEVCRTSEVAS